MTIIYFTPGPSQLFPTAQKHIQQALKDDICSLSHRSNSFKVIYKEAVRGIRKLLTIPDTHEIAFLSSSLEAMERIIENMVINKSFHVIDGAFSQKWYDMTLSLGKKSLSTTLELSKPVNSLTIPKHTELICITHNETSTGIMIPLSEIYRVKKRNPSIPIALDVVSSAPYAAIDFKYIDIAFFSVQKGLGLPAGLSILIVNKRLTQKSVGSYHAFKELFKKSVDNQTPETPNVLDIYLVAQVTKDMLKKRIQAIRLETEEKADMLYNFFETCNIGRPFITDKKYRSSTTIVIDVNNKSEQIAGLLKKKRMIVGRGYGEYKNTHIRIANFPQHSMKMMKDLISAFRALK
ncbi:alanine--glyoxylate aminotransferase family protein [Candidatus Roizmanbacteria bacterium]|nr:alanine--glyoxylate aminotransferase family protein [Candidatus Roizmanbacteria bacterium]